MGGRGTYAIGKIPDMTYKTVDMIEGVKVLAGINSRYHSLPEESNTSWAYIKLDHDGTFKEMRIYENHILKYELAYHVEKNIGSNGKKVLHYHTYDENFNRKTYRMPKAMRKHFKKYFKGVKL